MQVREDQIYDRDEMAKRNIMDGDSFMASTPSYRFTKPETEPYTPNLVEGAELVEPVDDTVLIVATKPETEPYTPNLVEGAELCCGLTC